MTPFVDPKNDLAFQKIFGDEKRSHVLISLLNAVLDLKEEQAIVSLEILSPHLVPQVKDLKLSVLDVRAKDAAGRSFIVEMQNDVPPNFLKRSLYYTSKAYTAQLKTGENYEVLRPVIFIGVLNDALFEDAEPVTRHQILNVVSGERSLKDFEFNFIELKKFSATERELSSVLDEWLYFLRYAPALKEVPRATKSEEVRQAYEAASFHNWSPDEQILFDIGHRDQINKGQYLEEKGIKIGKEEGIKIGREEGIEIGKEKGVEIGVHQNKRDNAKMMKEKGLDVALIAEITGLSRETIEPL